MAGKNTMTPALLASLGYGLALTLLLSLGAPWLRARPIRMALALAAACAFLHLPVAGVSLLAILRGVLGDLSIVSLVFLSILFLQRQRPLLPHAHWFALAGLVFFALSFGLSPLHLYAWGYASAVLPCLTGALAFFLWLRGMRALSLAFLAALAGWRLHWLDSTNLWDYLLDVPLVMVVLGREAFLRVTKKPAIRSTVK
jgi:hypothetical protein